MYERIGRTSRGRDRNQAPECREDLIVGGIIRHLVAHIARKTLEVPHQDNDMDGHITNNCSDSREASSATRNNADVLGKKSSEPLLTDAMCFTYLVSVLTILALAVGMIV